MSTFLDFPPNLFCFFSRHILTKSSQILPNLQNFSKILPKFTKSNHFLTKFLIYAVVLRFQIFVIYAFFRQICMPKKSGLTKKILFPTLVFLLSMSASHVSSLVWWVVILFPTIIPCCTNCALPRHILVFQTSECARWCVNESTAVMTCTASCMFNNTCRVTRQHHSNNPITRSRGYDIRNLIFRFTFNIQLYFSDGES